jgi:hypothetical protein
MDPEDLKEKDIKKLLQKYLNISYFKNNPEYISLWQKYYESERDPEILFFMKYKGVSSYYHWLYVELSKHFNSKNLFNVSRSILSRALNGDVYDRRVIEDHLSELPDHGKTMNDDEIYRHINPKSIILWGKKWVVQEESLFYNRDIFIINGVEVSFEEWRSMKEETDIAMDEINRMFDEDHRGKVKKNKESGGVIAEKKPTEEEKGLGGGIICEAQRDCHLEVEEQSYKRLKMESEMIKNVDVIDNNNYLEVEDVVGGKDTIAIGEFLYFISPTSISTRHNIMRIAEKDGNNQTVVSKEFILQRIDEKQEKLLKNLTCSHIPGILSFCRSKSELFVFYKNYKLGSLKNALHLLLKDSGMTDECLIAFYFKEVLSVILELRKLNLEVSQINGDSFMLCENTNQLVLVNFDFLEKKMIFC